MAVFHCQYPEHEGDRRVEHPSDRWVKRVTYYRADGAARRHEHVVEGGRRCSACVELEVAAERPPATSLQTRFDG